MKQHLPIDPFSLKGLAYWDPRRLFPTFLFRFRELRARQRFTGNVLPIVNPLPFTEVATARQTSGDTEVTPAQYNVLKEGLRLTEHIPDPCVEIGSFRGATTAFLARNTARKMIAVDPFFGWGGWEVDLQEFNKKTTGLENVMHLRLTAGQAASEIVSASFIFIDAVHDYANVSFELATYSPKVVVGGLVALHDTDNPNFAGVRQAIYEFSKDRPHFALLFHLHDLVVFQRRSMEN
jgi:hypothetical protein